MKLRVSAESDVVKLSLISVNVCILCSKKALLTIGAA